MFVQISFGQMVALVIALAVLMALFRVSSYWTNVAVGLIFVWWLVGYALPGPNIADAWAHRMEVIPPAAAPAVMPEAPLSQGQGRTW